MNTPFLHLVAGLSMTLATCGAMAMPPMHMPPTGHEPPESVRMIEHEPHVPWLRGITLTDEQQDKIFNLLHAQQPTMRAKEKELRQAGEALMKLAISPDFDESKARTLADTMARASADLALNRARTDANIYRLLSAEQRKQLTGDVARKPEPCREERPR